MKKYLYVISLLLPGILLQFVNPVFALFLSVLIILSALSSIVVIVVYLFDKKFKPIFLIGFFPIIFAYTLSSAVRYLKFKEAVEIQKQLAIYKANSGKYPPDLRELSEPYIGKKILYNPHSNFKEYEMEYYMDGFNRMYFNSEHGEWYSLGWND
jgi:hypothetical protein